MKIVKEIFLWLLTFLTVFLIAYAIEQRWILSLPDPVKTLYLWSGYLCYGFLLSGLILPKGRLLGLIALVFACLHLSVFVYFDFYFALGPMIKELTQKRYIFFGIGSFVLFAILGFFSFRGKFFRPLVYVVMLCALLGLVHIVLIQKVVSFIYLVLIALTLGILGFKVIKKRFLSPKVSF